MVGLVGTIPLGHQSQVYTHDVSNVRAYDNPNGGTVLVFTETSTGQTKALDEGGDNAELNFSPNKSTLTKKCGYNSQWVVPWRVSDCTFVVTTTAVDSTK
jgi:hypothetical protein